MPVDTNFTTGCMPTLLDATQDAAEASEHASTLSDIQRNHLRNRQVKSSKSELSIPHHTFDRPSVISLRMTSTMI